MAYEMQMTPRKSAVTARLDVELAGIQGQRELRLLRLSATLVAILFAMAIVWVAPWIPIGMQRSDFNVATSLAIVLVAALGVGTSAITLHWAPLFTGEPRSELFRALLGEPLSVRGRVRFLNRLRFQCEEGLRGRSKLFSVAAIELPALERGTPQGEGTANAVLREVRQVIRNADVLGDSEGREIWVLLTGAGTQGAESACARIAAALRERLPGRLDDAAIGDLLIGWGSFEVDGRDPHTLLRVAHNRKLAYSLSQAEPPAS